MSETTSYARAVDANLAHMGTPMGEWRSCAHDLAVDADGHVCVSSVLPSGYAPAPSLYHNNGAGDTCCELCGHKIRHLYYAQHDGRKWLLIVGSECVKAFAGVDGEDLADEAERALALDLLAWAVAARSAAQSAARAYDPYALGHGLRSCLFKLLDKCDNVSVDPLTWARRNKAAIVKALNCWARLAGLWPAMSERSRTPLPPLPRPPEAWLPENRKEAAP